jgi:Short C-terminal domain
MASKSSQTCLNLLKSRIAEVERSKARDLDRAAGARTLSVPEQIEKLADLVTKGVVTQAEFDAKKSQLLDKM